MAITLVGTTASPGVWNATTTTVNITHPSTNADDIIVIVIVQKAQQVISFPAGFSKAELNGGAGMRVSVAWKRATAGETTHAVTKPVDDNILFGGAALVYRGAATGTDPSLSTGQYTATSATVNSGSLAGFAIDDFAVFLGGVGNDVTSVAFDGSADPTWTNHFNATFDSTAGTDGAVFAASGARTSAGTVSGRTATLNAAISNIGFLVRIPVGVSSQQTTPGLLGTSVQFDPTVVPGQVAVVPGLLGTAILLDPMMVHRVSPDLLGIAQVFAPTDFIISDPTQQVIPALLGPSLIHNPVISAGAISAGMDLLGGAVVHNPAVTLSPYNIVPALLGTASLFNPTLQSSVAPGLVGGATLFAPSVVIVQAVQVDLLGVAVLYAPEVEMAPVNLFPGVLGVGSVLSPTLLLQLVTHGEVRIGINRPNRLSTGHVVIQSSTGHAIRDVIVSHTLEEDS